MYIYIYRHAHGHIHINIHAITMRMVTSASASASTTMRSTNLTTLSICPSVSLRGRPTAFLSPGSTANSREIDPALRRNRAPISVGPRPSSACHKRANLCSSTDMRGGCGWASLGRRATIGALWVKRMDRNCVGITSPRRLCNLALGHMTVTVAGHAITSRGSILPDYL